MKGNDSISTGSYSIKLAKKVSRIEKHAKANKTRRIVLFFLMILIASGGILYGISNKTYLQEERYREYSETSERSNLDPELLSYKDTYNLFVQEYLGNDPAQSMMGGYFNNNSSFMVYPNRTATCTLVNEKGREYKLAAFLADHINVCGDSIYYRNPDTRTVYLYDTVSHRTSETGIHNAGQFVTCGDVFYYIDLSQSSLVQFNSTTDEERILVEDKVLSFVVAGNDLFYLDSSHTLKRLNLSNNNSSIIGENITAFTFDGNLWIQNNDLVYQKKLDSKNLEQVDIGFQCNRLLGVSDLGLIFESEDGIYLFDLINNSATRIGTDLFVDMENDKVLWLSLTDNTIRLEELP